MEETRLTHLKELEAESIQIFREVVASFERPVMLYSIGKDSAVLLHLAMKAFYPAKPPFPLLHVDTTWKFKEMYKLRDEYVGKELGLDLIVHKNEEGLRAGINPITHGSRKHTDVMKTQALKQALDKHGFDAAFGGARRDEEKSRAKERVFSFRDRQHRWDPRNQRPELWNIYNTEVNRSPGQLGESIRVFPLSNWTELDVWQYIWLENIRIVPLYFGAVRPVVYRHGVPIMVDDDRLPLEPGEQPQMRMIRFRTLGCYPLSGAIESPAATLPEIIKEMLQATQSERQGRVIDHGRVGQPELLHAKARAQMLYYIGHWPEIDCIAAREAAMLGCVPLTSSVAVFGDPAKDYCVRVPGDPMLPETQRVAAMRAAELLQTYERTGELPNVDTPTLRSESWKAVAARWLEVMP